MQIIKIFASFWKEWLLLWRDKVGLILLFILPVCLVLLITLTEAQNPKKPHKFKMVLINQDKSQLMQDIVESIKKVKGLQIVELQKTDISYAKSEVAAGHYAALILIPETASQNLQELLEDIQIRQAQEMARGKTSMQKAQRHPVAVTKTNAAAISVLTDPNLPKVYRNQIRLSMQLILRTAEVSTLQHTLASMNHSKTAKPTPLITIHTEPLKVKGQNTQPNDIQRIVPAWTLFGMFFIITPLSGILVKERKLGVMARLRIAPVSFMSLILGKMCAFVLLNLVQLVLMLAVGVFLIPLFGFPSLNVTSHFGLLIIIGLCASLAATGFGLLIGSLLRSSEQANVIGPFLIVILASIGGIFMPVSMLPESIQKISALSPMQWAHMAFLDVFLRNADLVALIPNLGKLLALFLISIVLAYFKISTEYAKS